MPDIYPTGKLQLYSGIYLDPSYEHTLSYESESAMEAFWSNKGTGSLMTHDLTGRQYQRVTSGVCEVQLPINQVYLVNYMRFQNTDFSNKWFYAFVTKVEYVNNNNSRLYYELDVLTTYYYNWSFRSCFVERMHSTTDNIGDNIVEEPVKFGEPAAFARQEQYYNQFYAVITVSDFITISGVRKAIVASYGYTDANHDFHTISINGCTCNIYDLTTEVGLSDFQVALNVIAESQTEIVNIFLFPKSFFSMTGVSPTTGRQNVEATASTVSVARPTTLNGYTPRNKKLFTYPYCYLCVDNGKITNNYRYEYFNHVTGWADFSFVIKGVPLPTPNVFIAPLNYKNKMAGSYEPWGYVLDEKLDFPPLPQVAYPIDSYAAWLAQTESSRQNKIMTGAAAGVGTGLAAGAKLGGAIGAAGGPIGSVAGGAIGAALGGVLGAVGAKIANDMAITEAADMKNKASGAASDCTALVDSHWGVIFKKMTINAADAAIIDSFFDMFGYAQNKIMLPNVRSRDHWNYIKTNGCSVSWTAGIPADHIVKIKAIHDAGITYWKNHSEIGNYALTNGITPVTP